MATVREELHNLIDQLPEDVLESWLEQLQRDVSKPEKNAMLEWLEQAEQLQNKLFAEYGVLPSSVDIINEIREERLNDIMGGS